MLEDNKAVQVEELDDEQSSFNYQALIKTLILNWKWFLLSLIICLGTAYVKLRYTTPVYNMGAKLLIKDESSGGSKNKGLAGLDNMGMLSNSTGIDNEREIIKSTTIAAQAVRDLKLYVSYVQEGRLRDVTLYKDNPVNVDIDPKHLDKIVNPITMTIVRKDGKYHVQGTCYVAVDELVSKGPFTFERTFTSLPQTIATKAGHITIESNNHFSMEEGRKLHVTINSPQHIAPRYAGSLSAEPLKDGSSIMLISINDVSYTRGLDYLNQVAVCYNRQANDDKNEIAIRTENFINERLEKISAELNQTEGSLESFKRQHNMVELKMDATKSATNQSSYEQRLIELDTQIALINELTQFITTQQNKNQPIPYNVGLEDGTASGLIQEYNKLALERLQLLHTASENSPVVETITTQLQTITQNVRTALAQAKRTYGIQRNALATQYNIYTAEVSKTPGQERILTQIGRQREVTAGLYLMLLQKREENSISLAATANKGKLVDRPQLMGQVSPDSNQIYIIALAIGLCLPAVILLLIQLLRYRIEGHDDVAKLTKLPILADVAVANEAVKTRADIVVHENENNQMEEIFRSMRTNLQFTMKEGDKVVMFTSSTSGEGKTFNAANLAVSFALLGKRVLLVGLDIRKPRLAELFEIQNHHTGITRLLTMDDPTWQDVKHEILPSNVNRNLDLLLAGPVPPNPTELMARESLDKIFKHLREQYDYIFVDTAPVGLVTDTLQIGRVVDATIYMCRADYTPKSCFEMINTLHRERKLPNMSIVINGIDMSRKKYGYYYGYGKYGKYGHYGKRYSSYGSYGQYGTYTASRYSNKNDNSVKR